MKKYLAGVGLVLCISLPAGSEGGERQAPGKGEASKGGQPERSNADACDCCQKCKDAKGSIKPKVEEGVNKGDPCRVCCDACGTPAPPARKPLEKEA